MKRARLAPGPGPPPLPAANRLSGNSDLAGADRIEGNQTVERGTCTERGTELRVEQPCFFVQGHVVQQHCLHQQIHVVRRRAAAVHHVAAGGVRADLLVTGRTRARGQQHRATARGRRVVDQEERSGSRLVVTSPLTLAAAVDRVVDHAVRGQRAVAEYVDHQRLAATCGELQTRADTAARAQVAQLAGRAIAGVIVETAHADRARTRVPFDHELHYRRGLLELAVIAEVGAEDAAGADDVRVDSRIDCGWAAEARNRSGRPDVTALDLGRQFRGVGNVRTRIYFQELLLAYAGHLLHDRDGRGRIGAVVHRVGEQRAERARID